MLAGGRRRRRRLSLTPLVDVIFLLLLFFMLSSTFLRYSAVDVSAGSADPTAAPTSGPLRSAHLKLRGDGTLVLNGADVPAPALGDALGGLREAGTERLIVSAERGTTVQTFVGLMERLDGAPLAVVVVGGAPGAGTSVPAGAPEPAAVARP